jgi:hypothetical protein
MTLAIMRICLIAEYLLDSNNQILFFLKSADMLSGILLFIEGVRFSAVLGQWRVGQAGSAQY